MPFDPKDLDQEKLSSIRSEAEYLKDYFKIPLSFALLLASQFSIHDKLLDVKRSVDELWYDENEDIVKPKEPWENDDAA